MAHDLFAEQKITNAQKVRFNGLNDEYKGEISLDITNKKIRFSGNSSPLNVYYGGLHNWELLYLEIFIKDENQKLIKIIAINSKNNWCDVITNFHLQNGISYQDDYTIEIHGQEPSRIFFNIRNINFWKKINSNIKHHQSWKGVWEFRIKNDQLVEYYNSYSKSINFLGLNDQYKGEIGLDGIDKKIRFFGNNKKVHHYFAGDVLDSIYNTIFIFNEFDEIIKNIIISGTDTMAAVINKYNLQNGIAYQQKYKIEIYAKEPWRTQFLMNDSWKYLTKDRKRNSRIYNLKQKFIIINNKIFEYKENLNNNNYIRNLNMIINHSDKAILNLFNYINPNIDINELQIINKNTFEATIIPVSNSNKYTGLTKIYYTISSNNIININQLFKQSIFFSFRDKNNIFKSEIKSLKIDNLVYENVKLIKNSNITNERFIENICSGSIEFPVLSYEENYQSPSCEYNEEITRKYEIKRGLITTIGQRKSHEESTTKTINAIKVETTNWNWNVSPAFTIFGFGESIAAGGHNGKTSFTSKNLTSNISRFTTTVILENNFDFSDINSHEYKISKKLNFPTQPIKVLVGEKVIASIIVNKYVSKLFLILKQNIYGEINVVMPLTNINDITLNISIKEIMQKLETYNLLPPEITINKNNSVTFNGEILLTEIQNSLNAKLNIDSKKDSQIVKREISQWNNNMMKIVNNEKHLLLINNLNADTKNMTVLT